LAISIQQSAQPEVFIACYARNPGPFDFAQGRLRPGLHISRLFLLLAPNLSFDRSFDCGILMEDVSAGGAKDAACTTGSFSPREIPRAAGESAALRNDALGKL
jgi:hypothetical protein